MKASPPSGRPVRSPIADMREGLAGADIVMMLRLQNERMQGALSLDGEAQSMASSGDYEAVIQKLPEATISIYVDQRAMREAAWPSPKGRHGRRMAASAARLRLSSPTAAMA